MAICMMCEPEVEVPDEVWPIHAAVEHGLDLQLIREAEIVDVHEKPSSSTGQEGSP